MLQYTTYANTNVCFSCVFGEDVHSVCGSHGDFFQNEIFICLLKKDDPAYSFLICPQLPLFHSVSLNFSFCPDSFNNISYGRALVCMAIVLKLAPAIMKTNFFYWK